MKKLISIVLAVLLAACIGMLAAADEEVPAAVAETAITPAAVNAETATPLPALSDVEEGLEGKVYTVKCYGATKGQQYVLLIVAKNVDVNNGLQAKDILYIDQAAADKDGNLTFSRIQLRRNVSADVYIGGVGLESPGHPWYILVAGITVEGKITLVSNDAGVATIRILDGEGQEVASSETTAGGAFSVDGLQDGVTYDVRIEKPGYLPVTLKNVTLSSESDIPAVDMSGYGGDFNGDGTVDYRDLNLLIDDYGHRDAGITAKPVDINGDGEIDYKDLNALIDGYGKGSAEKDANNRPVGVVIDE